MKGNIAAAIVLATVPALAIPPPSFGFPEAPNDTMLTVDFLQNGSTTGPRYVPVTEAELFGIDIPENQPILSVVSAHPSL